MLAPRLGRPGGSALRGQAPRQRGAKGLPCGPAARAGTMQPHQRHRAAVATTPQNQVWRAPLRCAPRLPTRSLIPKNSPEAPFPHVHLGSCLRHTWSPRASGAHYGGINIPQCLSRAWDLLRSTTSPSWREHWSRLIARATFRVPTRLEQISAKGNRCMVVLESPASRPPAPPLRDSAAAQRSVATTCIWRVARRWDQRLIGARCDADVASSFGSRQHADTTPSATVVPSVPPRTQKQIRWA